MDFPPTQLFRSRKMAKLVHHMGQILALVEIAKGLQAEGDADPQAKVTEWDKYILKELQTECASTMFTHAEEFLALLPVEEQNTARAEALKHTQHLREGKPIFSDMERMFADLGLPVTLISKIALAVI